ncbi:sugar phosphate nucleotidyltransferase, partial [Chloroflexota bacterium]
TYLIPKPMVPVLNRPFLEHTITYLKQYGIEDIILAVSCLPEVIQGYFGSGSSLGVRLTYAVEDSPLGTAGAVKNAEQYLDTTFVVLNGDIFTNVDIDDMLATHRGKRAKATIALTRVDNPSAFGVVETNSDSRVQHFIEKPNPDLITSNWINAGIYILEPEVLDYVTANTHYMFEKGLFPLLLRFDELVYGYPLTGYWLDMGTPDKYLCLNCDLLLAQAKSALIDGLSRDKVYCDEGVSIHPLARIIGPVIIGSKCRIDHKAYIKGPVVMGSECHIGEGASIESSVLWDGVNIAANVRLKQCIVGCNTNIADKDPVIDRVVTADRNEVNNKSLNTGE